MTDETKKLFDAPWHVDVCEKGNPEFESVFLATKTGWLIGRDMEEETANRLARLPELYDALFDAANRLCGEPKIRGEYACKSCVVKDSCQVRKWYELLEKVRDGK